MSSGDQGASSSQKMLDVRLSPSAKQQALRPQHWGVKGEYMSPRAPQHTPGAHWPRSSRQPTRSLHNKVPITRGTPPTLTLDFTVCTKSYY